MAVADINKDTFQKEVLDHKGLVFVDFHAEWCGPCKLTSPIVAELSEEMKDMKFVAIDVDANPDIAAQYSVFSIPTFVVLRDGKAVHQFIGAMPKEGFEEEIKKAQQS